MDRDGIRPLMAFGAPLPPGFVALLCDGDPFAVAIAHAEAGAEPGTVVHGVLGDSCRFALVLSPDRPVADAAMTALAARSLNDALASLAPIGIPVDIALPHIRVNDGIVGKIDIRHGDLDTDGVAEWLVIAFDVAVRLDGADPGHRPETTCLAEEGFDASAEDVLAATCRHMLTRIDAFLEAAPLARVAA